MLISKSRIFLVKIGRRRLWDFFFIGEEVIEVIH